LTAAQPTQRVQETEADPLATAMGGARRLGAAPPERAATDVSRLQTNRADDGGGAAPPRRPVTAENRVGRNDPCPCGSGKKYKKCHGVGAA
jgi:uncharacterized protein YecA (UPF0149 family)